MALESFVNILKWATCLGTAMSSILQPFVQMYKTMKSSTVEKDHGRICMYIYIDLCIKNWDFNIMISAFLRPTTGFTNWYLTRRQGIKPTRIVVLVAASKYQVAGMLFIRTYLNHGT